MKNDNDILGCLGAFIRTASRLFIPVAILMAVAVFAGYVTETLTNKAICGVGLLAVIPVAVVFIVFSRFKSRD